MQINGLELVTSQSTQGHVSFTLQFALEKSIDAAATDVQTAISQATGSLPVDLPSPPTYSKTNPNDQPIMYIALTSDSVTAGRLYDYEAPSRPEDQHPAGRQQRECIRHQIRCPHQGRSFCNVGSGISIDDLVAAVRTAPVTRVRASSTGRGHCFATANGQLESAQAYGNLMSAAITALPCISTISLRHRIVQNERVSMRFWARGYGVPQLRSLWR